MILSTIIGQFPIEFDINKNLKNIIEILNKASEDDLVILPEGCLSGYSDDIKFLKDIDLKLLEDSLQKLKSETIKRKLHIILGSCIYENSNWYNAAIFYSYCNDSFIYKRVNLATHERNIIKAGDELPVYEIKIKGEPLKLGIQLCREARYPEQWKVLVMKGAEIFVYLTNGITGKNLSVWRSNLISRACENQRFLLCSNNADEKQHCPTMLISPVGEVISEIVSSKLDIIKTDIDTNEISNWYVNQSRCDIVKIVYKK